ncbi:response regulator [Planctomycetales bacterium]|nr:response regulator [Planctomycetales bacterium]GHS97544.1 response regulator [Planctomycetales bacterium]GHT07070.1 response regulator [Planctomycetales bacterium]GHV22067.1 response regulator [Planctomycetales bacterium]
MAYNIVIVDDSATVRSVLKKTLHLSGVAVGVLKEANNGREALEILRDGWFDLVFTDINMPEMNGIELINTLANDEVMSTIPIVVVSTDGSSSRIEEVKAKGVRAYVRKPFTPECIRDVINGVLIGDPDGDEGIIEIG